MRSLAHALISVAVAGLAIVALDPSVPAPAILLYAGVLGVAIDLDHFPIARVNSGDWSAVARVLERPSIVVLDQGAIFTDYQVWPLQRLLSHVVVGSVVVAVLLVVSRPVAVVSAVVLYAHVLADLVHDNYRHDEYLRRAAGYRADRE